jgi:hypothetical protein
MWTEDSLAAGERPNALYKCPPWSACGLTCFKQEAAAGDFVAPYLCMWWQGSTNELHAFRTRYQPAMVAITSAVGRVLIPSRITGGHSRKKLLPAQF